MGDVDDRESKWRAKDLCMQESACCVTVDLLCQHHQFAAISKRMISVDLFCMALDIMRSISCVYMCYMPSANCSQTALCMLHHCIKCNKSLRLLACKHT